MAERYPWLKKRQRQARKLWAVQNIAESGGHLLLGSAVVIHGQWKLNVPEDELLRKGYLIKTSEGVVDAPNDNWKCIPMGEYLNGAPEEKPVPEPEPNQEPDLQPDPDPEPDPEPEEEIVDEEEAEPDRKKRRKRKKSESGE